jgi:hypothetical protein
MLGFSHQLIGHNMKNITDQILRRPSVDGDDHINFIQTLFNRWRLVGASILASLALALGICYSIPNQYEASGILLIGRLVGDSSSTDIEPAPQLVERINSGSLLTSINDAKEEGKVSLKATLLKNTKLVQITTRAGSRDTAAKSLSIIMGLILEEHSRYSLESKRQISQALEDLQNQVVSTNSTISRLNTLVNSQTPEKNDAISTLLITQTQKEQFSHQARLKDRISVMTSRLSEQEFHHTRVVKPALVGGDPVYPNTRLVALIALVGGALLGGFLAFGSPHRGSH